MEHVKNSRNLLIVGSIGVLSLVAYFWMVRQPFFENFVEWAAHYFLLYFFLLVFFKALAIIWPPIPGGLLTLGSVAVIGWQYAFLGQVLGGLVGGSIAFFLGRKYGLWLLKLFFDQAVIDKIQKIKIYNHREFEAVFFLRIFTTTISEAVSYGSGLLKIKFRNFFFATLCGFIFELPLFYLAESILSGRNFWLSGSLVLVAGLLFYKLKGRYFE
jgi:uncharacterized membrane protein YdjX (TVP38/TMEM64 family)